MILNCESTGLDRQDALNEMAIAWGVTVNESPNAALGKDIQGLVCQAALDGMSCMQRGRADEGPV